MSNEALEVVDAIIDETSNAMAVHDAYTPAKVVGGIPYLQEYLQLSNAICKTAMVPSALRNKPEETLAVMMYGAELGIGPMQALQQINFIAGKPSAAAELLRALVMEAGHKFIIEATKTVATARCKRKDWDDWEVTTFTFEDARQANLTSGDGWKKYPDQMLSARVTSKACRMFFPDVISGMSYTPEEIESFTPPAPTQPAKPSRTSRTETATVTRAAPVVERSSLASPEDVQKLSTALGMLDEHEKESIKPQWLAQNFPKKLGDMTPEQVNVALGILSDVLNRVSDEPESIDEPDIVEAQIVVTAPSAITQPQIAKIRIMLENVGVGKDDVHARVSQMLGREIASLKDLTKTEASSVIDQLATTGGNIAG